MTRMTPDGYKRAAAVLESLPDLVIEESHDRDMTPAEVAKASGVPASVLMEFADGRLPPLPSAIKLLRWLGTPPPPALVPYPNGHTHPTFIGCSEAKPPCPKNTQEA